ncbi:MAG: hypothetical protein HGA35_05255 [Erysipelotrichaceae bacterium]|nr:hypothetical protein [Erysipelotrichaceae bacterium]
MEDFSKAIILTFIVLVMIIGLPIYTDFAYWKSSQNSNESKFAVASSFEELKAVVDLILADPNTVRSSEDNYYNPVTQDGFNKFGIVYKDTQIKFKFRYYKPYEKYLKSISKLEIEEIPISAILGD